MSDKKSGPSVSTIPAGDHRPRLVCGDCGFIQYENPKIVVGAVCTWEDRFLMCRRAIEPRRGFWTFPSGFMEMDESSEDGAAREAWEEAQARIKIDSLLAVYNLPRIGQVHIIYRAHLLAPEFGPSDESLEVELMDHADLPWDQMAFPTIAWALRDFVETKGEGVRTNPVGDSHCLNGHVFDTVTGS